jgi:hypothetical protein
VCGRRLAPARHRFVVAICAFAALALAASAQAKDLVPDLPAHLIVETFPLPGPNDPERCIGASFVEFPEIRNAKGYRIVATDVKYGAGTQERSGPPFAADHFDYGSIQSHAHWDAPAGFHRVWYSAASTGKGCAQAILGLDGQWKIVSAKVNMTAKFQKRVDKAHKDGPKACAIKGSVEHVKLKGATKTIIRRPGGRIFVTREGSGVRARVTTGTVEMPGSVVETGSDSWIQITNGSDSFVLGPHVKIRVTSSGFDILEHPRNPPPPPEYWIEHYYYENSVRTCSGWAPLG